MLTGLCLSAKIFLKLVLYGVVVIILNYVNFHRENWCNFKNTFGIFSHAGAEVALLVRVSILHLDVSHMFYIGRYSVPSWQNVVSREEIR